MGSLLAGGRVDGDECESSVGSDANSGTSCPISVGVGVAQGGDEDRVRGGWNAAVDRECVGRDGDRHLA